MSDDRAKLGELRIESGVSAFTGEPFCHVHVLDAGGELLTSGQLKPEEVRVTALAWLEAAEAAVSDAAVWKIMRGRVGLDEQAAATFLAELRASRSDQQ